MRMARTLPSVPKSIAPAAYGKVANGDALANDDSGRNPLNCHETITEMQAPRHEPSGPHAMSTAAVRELQVVAALEFADWPDGGVPRRSAGVYTVWRQEELLYAGMSRSGAQAEDFTVTSGGKAVGLWTRLNSHASGRRSGDQFNIYICDRFVVPVLTPDQQQAIASGQLLLDRMTRNFIRQNLTYRYLICRDGTEALAIERSVRAGQLPAGRPYLNPL